MRIRAMLIACGIILCATSLTAKTPIEWWQFWTDPGIKPTVDSLVAEFEQANPDIDVTVTDLTWANGQEKIAIAFASGSAPDVLEIGSDWIAQFAANGHLADISEQISPDSAAFQGWGMSTYNGKVFGKPWILGTRIMFANRDLLTKAGYPPDFVPVTMKQLEQAALKIRSLGKDIYGWGSNTAEKHRLYKKWLPFFWTFDAQLFSDDGKYCVISSEQGISSLRFYKRLSDSTGYVADQRGIEDAFLDGKIGFIISGDWLLKRIELENRKINLVSSLIPGMKYPGRSFLGGEFLSLSAKGPHKDQAMKFVNFMTSPTNQVRFCKANRSANPSSKEAQKDPYFTANPHLRTFIAQIHSAVHPPVDPAWPAMEDAIEGAVEDALFGSKLPAQALRNANIKITEARKRNEKS